MTKPTLKLSDVKYLSKKDFSSAVAKWAVQLSPYSCPDDLARVVIKADGAWPITANTFSHHQIRDWSYDEFKEFVYNFVNKTPEIVAWGQTKSGKVYTHKFISAFDSPTPAGDDFIDLSALAQAILIECWNKE